MGTDDNDWVSMGVYSNGEYGIAKGLIYSFPVTCANGDWSIVADVDVSSAFSKEKMAATEQELSEERDAVAHLLP